MALGASHYLVDCSLYSVLVHCLSLHEYRILMTVWRRRQVCAGVSIEFQGGCLTVQQRSATRSQLVSRRPRDPISGMGLDPLSAVPHNARPLYSTKWNTSAARALVGLRHFTMGP
jgi:hypothetical protein